FSAIVRSCDAVGAFEAHAVWPNPRLKPNHMSSGGAGKWVRIQAHPNLDTAVEILRGKGMQIIAAHLNERARDYRQVDFTRPTAILLGAELAGVSAEGLKHADFNVSISMAGMVESLNVSVAAAVLLFEARQQREAAGLYSRSRLDPEIYQRTLFEWCHPDVAAYCRRGNRPYPALDEHGEIVGRVT
ncbi:MAG: tRNA (guanine-N2)-dimethyltransferase, partial [Gammaproteobacteria bacterium]|nr:tRNA (guanine-N2)-dimethyltransferase [Gammaproteobacteria bacterium]